MTAYAIENILQINEIFSIKKLEPIPDICSITLIGMRGDILIFLFFLDQILSAEFLSKNSKRFWMWKLTSIGLIWQPTKLIEFYKKMPIGGAKDELFFLFL